MPTILLDRTQLDHNEAPDLTVLNSLSLFITENALGYRRSNDANRLPIVMLRRLLPKINTYVAKMRQGSQAAAAIVELNSPA